MSAMEQNSPEDPMAGLEQEYLKARIMRWENLGIAAGIVARPVYDRLVEGGLFMLPRILEYPLDPRISIVAGFVIGSAGARLIRPVL